MCKVARVLMRWTRPTCDTSRVSHRDCDVLRSSARLARSDAVCTYWHSHTPPADRQWHRGLLLTNWLLMIVTDLLCLYTQHKTGLTASFQINLRKPESECQAVLDLTETRDDRSTWQWWQLNLKQTHFIVLSLFFYIVFYMHSFYCFSVFSPFFLLFFYF